MASEIEAACPMVYTKSGDIVRSLIAAIEERIRGIEVEAARIISAGPFFSYKLESAVGTY
jgi:hypothetical protein